MVYLNCRFICHEAKGKCGGKICVSITIYYWQYNVSLIAPFVATRKSFEFEIFVPPWILWIYLHTLEPDYVGHQGTKVSVPLPLWTHCTLQLNVGKYISFRPQRCSVMRGAKTLTSLQQSSLMVSLLVVFHVSSPEIFGISGHEYWERIILFQMKEENFLLVISLIHSRLHCW